MKIEIEIDEKILKLAEQLTEVMGNASVQEYLSDLINDEIQDHYTGEFSKEELIDILEN